MTDNKLIAPVAQIESQIFLIRGQKVMLDADLAELYGVPTKRLNEQVRRNSERFPEDFMFQLTTEEFANLKSEFETSSLRSQIATSNNLAGRGGRRHLPYAFTEHGAIMAASVLNSPRAVEASVQVVRAFVQLRQMLASNAELSRELVAMEKKYDIKFKAVFDAIHELMIPFVPKKKLLIGFAPREKKMILLLFSH
jgi:hypothetical protein